jgi:hypothetical protein
VARSTAGAPCNPSLQCQDTLSCIGYVPAQNGQPAMNGACRSPGQVGDACLSFGVGFSTCTPGLFCDGSSGKPLCAARVAAGTACAQWDACTDGLACVGLKIQNSATKGACAAFLDIGKPCDPSIGETGCTGDARCDATTKTCAVLGVSGDDCSAKGTSGRCADNLYCDSLTLKCTAQLPLGAACTPPQMVNGVPGDDPCHDGSCGASKVCAAACM